MKQLWPINRSITGKGTLKTLKIIKSVINLLKIKKIKSKKKIFDWSIPLEWNVKNAYIITPRKKKICQFKKNNLHLVGYSHPIKKTITFNELNKHLHSWPKNPSSIPYITCYYKKYWGFCISHKEKKKLSKKGRYQVIIQANFKVGALYYGELLIKGKSKKEIFISTYVCHPSMANNELSGPVLVTHLSKWILSKKRKYTYRIIFVPETIGSIAYINKNLNKLKKNVLAGFNVTCVGDNRSISFLPSKYNNTYIDKVLKHFLSSQKIKYKTYDWSERGSDERQYCSPGVDLPVASLMRSKYGTYKEYHTSDDRIGKVVTKQGLTSSLEMYKKCIIILEKNFYPISTKICEPMLSKYSLYENISNRYNKITKPTYLDILTWCDGKNDVIDIAEKNKSNFFKVLSMLEILEKNKLIYKKFL